LAFAGKMSGRKGGRNDGGIFFVCFVLYFVRGNFVHCHSAPLQVFIFGEQTKENNENVGSLFFNGLQNFVMGRHEAIR
jgi:hypothetical protein